MMLAGKARAGIGARTVTGAAILAAVFTVSVADPAHAQTPAPIVYKLAVPAAPATQPVRFENKLDEGQVISIAPRAPVPTLSSPLPQSAFDLRPGAVKASFGPAVPTPTTRIEAPKPLMSAPTAQAFAEPYAGPPYEVAGKWYVPAYEPNYDEVGVASWYGPTFHGKDSASGEVFDEMAMTAAHPTLPIPSLVRVTNLTNGKTVIVRLNDRGPFVDDRIIDLSRAAGAALDMHKNGTVKVRVQYVGPAPVEPNALPAKAGQPQPLNVVAQTLPPLAAQTAPTQTPKPALNGFFLQAGSFADLANANALRDRLKPMGQVSITAVTVGDTDYYRVMVGPWTSRSEAEQAQGRLAQAGDKTIVVAKN